MNLAAEELTRALGTQAKVGTVEYRFPARIAFKDVFIEDQQHDTLFYAGELYAAFRPIALFHNEIAFSGVRVKDVVANIYKRRDGTWNYAFLVPPKKHKEQHDPFRSILSVRDIRFENLRVRYESFYTHLDHADMDLRHLSAKALDAQINDIVLSMTRKGSKERFDLQSVQAHLIVNDTIVTMPTLTASLPHSRLDMSGIEVLFPAGDLDIDSAAHDIKMGLTFHEARLVPADIALFVPRVARLNRAITLNGAVTGTLDSLAFQSIALRYDGKTVMEGNVSAVGMPDINRTYLRANLTDFQTNAAQLQDFLSRLNGRPVTLPAAVYRLGTIRYRGLAKGRLDNLTLHGAFRTSLGTITTDGTFRSDSILEHMTYNAKVEGRRFQLGRMIDHAPLGSVSVDVQTAGRIDTGKVRGEIRGHVRELTYKDYTYSDLHLDGSYAPNEYRGQFFVDDPHISMFFNGVVDLNEQDPELNFNLRCEHFDMEPITDKEFVTRFNLAVDMSGSETDRMSGYLVLDSLYVSTDHDTILMKQLTLLASGEVGHSKSFTLRSDYLYAHLDGVFRYKDLVPAAQQLIHYYLPSAVLAPKQSWEAVSFNMRADGERLREIQRLFIAPIILSDHPTFTASAYVEAGEEPEVDIRFFAPGVRAGNTPVHDLTFTLNTIDTLRHVGAQGSGLAMSVSAEAMQLHLVLSALAFQDTLLSHLTVRQQAQMDELLPEGWRSLSPRELQRALSNDLTFREKQRMLLAAQRAGNYGGDLKLLTHFSRYNKRPLIDMHLMPGTLLLRDSLYTLAESRITYCAADTTLQVEHFAFEGGGQHIRANGLASTNPQDTLAVALQKIDASYVVPFLLPVQTIMFNGLLTGEADITGVFTKPQVDTKIHIDSMGLNNVYFGEAEVDLHITDSLAFHADVFDQPEHKLVDLEGKALFNGIGTWNLDMQADQVPLSFVNHWTSAVLTDLDGTATGKVVVGGYKGYTYVLVRAAAKNASLTLPWTGARYTIPHDTIVLDTTAIRFPNVHLVDVEGNKVELSGAIDHEQFRNFALDLHVDAHKALVFDKEAEGEMLRGHVYADGHVDVVGEEKDLVVIADAVTTRNSRFRLSIDNVATANESNFIHFVHHEPQADSVPETDLDNIDHARKVTKIKRAERLGRCLLQLGIEVNPQLQFQLVLGERNGDMIQARGSGALKLNYDTETGDVKLLGTYDIDRGTLSYTVANAIHKEFTVGEGSTIVFSGNPNNPQLNVTAKYRVTANLKDLFGEEVNQLATTRTNIPVLTCMHLSGFLSNPTLSFSLEFPTSDQSVQQQVRQVINTDEMLMRQVIYLLVFGRFYTPEYIANAEQTTLNSTYSLLSSTVTSQINAWLSKLTNMLTVGVAIRSEGEGEEASQEYEAQFQLQPVDRLIINGNFGYRYNDVSNQPFFGDLDVELLLTEDGQWRLKGYTHTVDKYSLRQATTIQGFGFMWKKDFNWPSVKRRDRKETTPAVEKETK